MTWSRGFAVILKVAKGAGTFGNSGFVTHSLALKTETKNDDN